MKIEVGHSYKDVYNNITKIVRKSQDCKSYPYIGDSGEQFDDRGFIQVSRTTYALPSHKLVEETTPQSIDFILEE